MSRILIAVAVALSLCGCTSALFREAGGHPEQVPASEVVVRIEYARIIEQRAGASSYQALEICLSRQYVGSKSKDKFTARTPYPLSSVPQFELKYSADKQAVSLRPSVVLEGCDVTEPVKLVEDLPLVVIQDGQQAGLDAGTKHGIYVSYVNGSMAGLGYLSVEPALGNYHNVNIDLSNSQLYSRITGRKPYLYVFTPVTMAADVVGAVGAVAFFTVMIIGCSGGGCR